MSTIVAILLWLIAADIAIINASWLAERIAVRIIESIRISRGIALADWTAEEAFAVCEATPFIHFTRWLNEVAIWARLPY
jgi:hypothetical protein